MLAWQLVRVDARTASVALGIAEKVAQIIGKLQLTELDQIADRRHRHLEPRWADRPAAWRSLLSSALAPESAAMKRVEAYGLQLLAGDLLPISKHPRPPDLRRAHTVSPQRET
jgi:hypothetical protein